MKKLNANEILEIVEKNYSVESFGYNDLLETQYKYNRFE